MRSAKLGAVAALIVLAVVGVLWVTEAVPRDDLKDVAPKALGAILILVLVGVAWSAMRGPAGAADETDKKVP
jgi:hypothetical protein